MRLDNRINERVNPKKEALIIAIIYLVIGSMVTAFYDIKFFIVISTVVIYFMIYDRVKRIKNIINFVAESLEELSATTQGLVDTQEKLEMEQMLTENIINNSSLVIFTWDLDYKILSFNPYSERVTGYKEEEVIGKSWIDLFLYDDEKPKVDGLVRYLKTGKPLKNTVGDVWKTKHGRDLELIWTDSPVLDENNNLVKIISIGSDITDQKNLVKRLNKIAYYDGLTGLPNRILLEKEATRILDEAIMADITFPRYAQTTEIMGGRPVIVPLKEFSFDLNGILEKISPRTKVIWICNPNNPTGTMITEREFVEFLDKVPSNILVISDEAYREYVTKDDYPFNSIDLTKKYENLLIMRTFSKAYGLAGIRVAYTIGNKEILQYINRVRGPFNVNSLAQVAAIAAIEDEEFLKKSYEINLQGKNFLYEEFDKLKLHYVPSETNHILVNVGRDGQEVFIEMQKRGVIIRPVMGNYIRVSIGTMDENKMFIENLIEVLKE
jgi:histidinol-phosphate aminotransferase